LENTQAYNPKCLVPTVNHVKGSVKVWAAILQYSLGPLDGQITAREYVDRFSNRRPLFSDDAVFKNDNAPNHTAGIVHSQCEEHEGELQRLPWPAQSPDIIITELLLWSVLKTRARNNIQYL
jgi:hypothetical protein